MAAGRPIVSDQDYGGRAKLIRPVLAQPAAQPADADTVVGEFWLDPVSQLLTYRDATKNVEPTNRSAHHGTQPASSISDLGDVIRAVRLDELAAPTAGVQFNGQPAKNVGAPTEPNDGARMAELSNVLQYVNGLYTPVEVTLRALSGAALMHIPVLAATWDTWDFPTLPATIDGVVHDGDPNKPVLVLGQSGGENNGIWYPVPNPDPGGPYWRRVSQFTNAAGEVVDVPETVASGTIVHVVSGERNANRFYTYNNGRWLEGDTDPQAGDWSRLISSNDSINDLYPPRDHVNFFQKRLMYLADSVDPDDAVNRRELDALRASIEAAQDTADQRTLDQIPPPALFMNFNGQELRNVAPPMSDTSAVPRGYVLALRDATEARTLDLIPTAAATVNLGAQKLAAVADGTDPQDAIVRHQLDDLAAALRAEDTASRAAIDAAIASTDATVAASNARTLDQIPTAAAAVNLGGQEVTNAGAPTTAGSLVTRGYVEALQQAADARTLDQIPPPAGPVDMNSQRLRNVGAPQEDSDGVSRGYVRGLLVGMDWKPNARAVAEAAHPLTDLGTVGGVALVDGDRVVAPNATDPTRRLIYIARAGAWDVAPDSAAGALSAGTTVAVTEGTGRGIWRLLTSDPITVGTTQLSWEPLPIADYTASDGVIREGINFRADYTKVARTFEAVFGDGAATQYVVGHGLGQRITASVWEVATGELLDARVVNDPATGLFATVYVSVPPGPGAYRFVATGGG